MLDPNTADERVLGEVSQCVATTWQQQTWTALGEAAHTVRFEHVGGSGHGTG